MASRIVGSATALVMVLIVGIVLLGCGAAEAQPAAPPAPAAKAAVKPVVAFTFLGTGECTKDDQYADPTGGGKDQTVLLEITENNLLMPPRPRCAKESAKGSLTFQVGPTFPVGYELEIDIVPVKINNKGRKGPFKRAGDKEKYPVDGRCVLKEPNDWCKFESKNHHSRTDVPNKNKFGYNILLIDSGRNVVDAIDPGIMVTDNP